MNKLRVGTRGSLLALTQTRIFTTALVERNVGLSIEEVLIQTQGDVSSEPLNKSTTPGLFVSALREALLENQVDFIVHSMKDLPAKPFPGIVSACIPKREDSRDGLVSRGNLTLSQLPQGARVGTSSPRRTASILRSRPDLRIEPIRGNIDTRIAKVQRGEYDATLLAMAGLNRIGRADEVCQIFENDDFIPAAGQGALAIECREEDVSIRQMLAELDDPVTRLITAAERHVLVGLDAGCATAIGAHATFDGSRLTLRAELAVEETGEAELVTVESVIEPNDFDSAQQLGLKAAKVLLESAIASKAAWK